MARWSIDGSKSNCIRNIVTHFDVLLDDAMREEINWHEGQHVSLAVMRALAAWHDARERLAAMEQGEERLRAIAAQLELAEVIARGNPSNAHVFTAEGLLRLRRLIDPAAAPTTSSSAGGVGRPPPGAGPSRA